MPRTNFRLLSLIAFISGACVMILEILGSRLLAPFFGTTLFAWTSLIGVVLAGLSAGYWLGGKLADREPSLPRLSLLLFGAGIYIAFLPLLINFLSGISFALGMRFGPLLLSLLLFLLPSIFMGTVSPYVVRLASRDVEHVGAVAGTLYAISTLGSILGVLLAGFWLIPSFGLIIITEAIAALLIILSLIGLSNKFLFGGLSLALLLAFSTFTFPETTILGATPIHSEDSEYQHLTVLENNASAARYLLLDAQLSGGRFMDSSGHVFEYTTASRLSYLLQPSPQRALFLGAGPTTEIQDLRSFSPETEIDLVEIDPAVIEIDKKFFSFSDDEKITVVIDDARSFLQTSNSTYDLIFVDTYNSIITIPPHLTTKEFISSLRSRLSPDGVVVLNVIGRLEGPGSEIVLAEYATYHSVFPHVYVFPLHPSSPTQTQNVILLATSRELTGEDFLQLAGTSGDVSLIRYSQHFTELSSGGLILTDDYAPVESLMAPLFD